MRDLILKISRLLFVIFTLTGFHFEPYLFAHAGFVSGTVHEEAEMTTSSDIQLITIEPHLFYFQPDVFHMLPFRAYTGNFTPGEEISFRIINLNGQLVTQGTSIPYDNKNLTVTVNLSSGFYRIEFPSLDAVFGISVLPYEEKERDLYFGLHTDLCRNDVLTNLGTNDQKIRLESLFQTLDKTGIGVVRDRIRPAFYNPGENVWQFGNSGNHRYEDALALFRKYSINVFAFDALAPGWMRRPEDRINPTPEAYKYPTNLHAFTTCWDSIFVHWQDVMTDIEIWNEPRGNTQDRLAPMLHAMAYRFRERGHNVRLPGCAFVGSGAGRMNNDMGEMNSFQALDQYSYHQYSSALQTEQLIKSIRTTLANYGNPYLPLVNSESGDKYIGGAWPSITQDIRRSTGITAKTIETKALGVKSHYLFTYAPRVFSQGTNVTQQSIICQYGTPFLVMASYVTAAHLLSHRDYIGDYATGNPSLLRSRVFADTETAILVLYSNGSGNVQINAPVQMVYGLDGRDLQYPGSGPVALTDEMIYVVMNRSDVEGLLDKNTPAMELFEMSKLSHLVSERKTYPVVLQHFPDYDHMEYTSSGYDMLTIFEQDATLYFQASNLSDIPQSFEIELELPEWLTTNESKTKTINVDPSGTTAFTWQISFNPDSKGFRGDIRLFSTDPENNTVSPLIARVLCQRDVQEVINSFRSYKILDVYNQSRWSTWSTTNGFLELTTGENKVDFRVNAWENKDWMRGRYNVANVDFTMMRGLVVVSRTDPRPSNIGHYWPNMRFGVEERGEDPGRYYSYYAPYLPQDGRVRWSFVDFENMPLNFNDPNQQLDLDEIVFFSTYFNHGRPELPMEAELFTVYMVSDSMLWEKEFFDVHVQVLDMVLNKPVEGAVVKFNSTETTTGEDGKSYSGEFRYGLYDASVTIENYYLFEKKRILVESDTILTFLVQPHLPDIKIKVIDKSSGLPVNRPTITYNGTTRLLSTQGEISMDLIPYGNFLFELNHNSYFSLIDSFTVSGDTTVIIPLVRKQANLTFSIIDQTGLPGVPSVTASGWTLQVNSEGKVYFYNIPARNDVMYSVQKPGIEPFHGSLYLELDTIVDISLFPVGINKDFAESILIFPNPASRTIFVDLTAWKGIPANLSIVDLTGRKVYSHKEAFDLHEVDISNLQSGMYFIVVEREGLRVVKKVQFKR